jgi:S1-C subfamily serine protease
MNEPILPAPTPPDAQATTPPLAPLPQPRPAASTPDTAPAPQRAPLSPVYALLMGGVLACVLVLIGYFLGASKTAGPNLFVAGSGDGGAIERAVQLVGPAVMNVDTELGKAGNAEFLPPPGMGDEPRKGKGTGVVIDSKRGLMLTNAHVVSDPATGASAKKITVTTRDGKTYSGKVRGKDRESDIAVVELENKSLPAARLASYTNAKELSIGQWVIAIGNPFGQANTVTVGVLSAIGRELPVPGGQGGRPFKLTDLLQTDTAINPGNSGGPLCNLKGEVVAINTAIIPYGTGLGFCIPIYKAKAVADELIKNGKIRKPFIGVLMKPIDKALQTDFGMPDQNGAFVQSVVPGSPAAKAGLKLADVIRKIDGQTMKDDKAVADYLSKKKIGATVKIEILRNNSVKKTVTLKIIERPED